MANSFAHDKMCTIWEQAAETTGMNMTLSKDLETYTMSDMANKDRTGNASNTNFGSGNGDREYIPQEYRFEVKNGIETTDADFQDVIDRMIPVNRIRSFNVPATIKAKELQDPQRIKKVADGFARDIANKIDTVCYQTMIEQATMFVSVANKFTFEAGIDAETLMLNRGLSKFNRKLFLSNKHYAAVAKDLGAASRDVLVQDALSRAKIPDLATFDTMRSDYLLNLAGNTTANITVNGNQSATVATFGADGFYKDNRSMTLALTNATTANMPVGTKFTIAGVNAVHPETRQDTGSLMTFTVIAAANGAPIVQPAIVVSGPYQNCTAQAATGNAVVILNKNTDAPSLFYTPESTVIVPGVVPVIGDGVKTMTLTTENGIPMTMVYWYDGHKMQYNMKAVFNFDVQVVYPNMLGMIMANQA
ncbi:MAG: P22 phage major capsid protein family protein [Aeromonadaceae bacterium]